MRVSHLSLKSYRSIRDVEFGLGALNVFIGPNASGKSSILDALRLLYEGLIGKDFEEPMSARGGFAHLAWKGEEASRVEICVRLEGSADRVEEYEWRVAFWRVPKSPGFSLREELQERTGQGQRRLLDIENGRGFWLTAQDTKLRVEQAQQSRTACVLAAASSDEAFRGRRVADYVRSWSFFDPMPALLRRASERSDASSLEMSGRNLAARLHALREHDPVRFEKVVAATRGIVGTPERVDFRDSPDGDRFYLVLKEPGLKFLVHQAGVSSGTLRILALMTGLLGHEGPGGLIGIEEPENYVHPSALEALTEYLRSAASTRQVLLTTHSPLLLNRLDDPEAVLVVQRNPAEGTTVSRAKNPEGIRRALEESGFGLGEYYQTRGFGA